jgi:hypothetical protein
MKEKKNWLYQDSILWTRAYESRMLPQILSVLWRIIIDLQYLKKTLRLRDLYSLKLDLSKKYNWLNFY